MATYDLTINGERHTVDVDPDTPLLWVIRDTVGLNGTKFGCGLSQCGACTMLLNDMPTRTCMLPVSAVAAGGNLAVTTIEGADQSGELAAVQQAWLEVQTPQCGYCQSGQIMTAYSLLKRDPNPSDAAIDAAMQNACRCGTYPRIRTAIHRAAEILAEEVTV